MVIDIERLLAFRAVVTEKTFTKAAEKLFKTQPAISQAIRSLESELGERLFLRLGRTTVLTEAGRILLEHVDDAFDALDLARARIAALKELRQGTLTISASDTTACYVLPPVLRAFRKRYPGVHVVIRNRPSPVVADQVAAREADIGLVTLPVEHPKLATIPLAPREDVAICAARHPLANRKRIKLNDLATCPLVLIDRGANTRSFIDRQFDMHGIAPRIVMELGSIEVVKTMVALGFGVSIVPHLAVREEVKRGLLHASRVFDTSAFRVLGIVHPNKGILSPAAQVMVKMLKDTLGKRGLL